MEKRMGQIHWKLVVGGALLALFVSTPSAAQPSGPGRASRAQGGPSVEQEDGSGNLTDTFVPTDEPPLDDVALYRDLLMEYVMLFEDEAARYYQKNLEVAYTSGVWNPWIEKSRSALHELRPDLQPAQRLEATRPAGYLEAPIAPPILKLPLEGGDDRPGEP